MCKYLLHGNFSAHCVAKEGLICCFCVLWYLHRKGHKHITPRVFCFCKLLGLANPKTWQERLCENNHVVSHYTEMRLIKNKYLHRYQYKISKDSR